MKKISKTEKEWKTQLTPEEFCATRQKATEPPFSGVFWNHKKAGIFQCVCCGADLFGSETKYDSGTGWPSFWAPVGGNSIELEEDRSHGMWRTEVRCARCDAHLGHVFSDGPKPTGLRYCINSLALKFFPKEVSDEISPLELKRALEGANPPFLLDVREPDEYEIVNLGGKLIPLSQLKPRIKELPRNTEIVVHCHRGKRSRQAIEVLKRAGFKRLKSLAGGIDGWAKEIDPALSRY